MADEDENGAVNASLDDDPAVERDDDEEGGGGGLDAKKIILFIVAPLLIIGGVVGGLFFTGTLDKLLGGEKTEEVAHEEEGHGGGHGEAKKGGHGEEEGEHGESTGIAFLEIPDIIVNLNTPDGQPRYLRLSVQLELKSYADQAAVEAVMPRVVDQFQTYLRELRVRDLRGTAGIYRLQIELLARVNAAAYPVEVQDVLFQEILIQ